MWCSWPPSSHGEYMGARHPGIRGRGAAMVACLAESCNKYMGVLYTESCNKYMGIYSILKVAISIWVYTLY